MIDVICLFGISTFAVTMVTLSFLLINWMIPWRFKRNEHEGQCHQLFLFLDYTYKIRHSTVAFQMFKILFFDKDGFFEETRKQQGENVEQGT